MIRKRDFFIKVTFVYIKNKFLFTNVLLYKNNKTRHFRIGFCFAPPIGESCSFDSMVKYSIILKSCR